MQGRGKTRKHGTTLVALLCFVIYTLTPHFAYSCSWSFSRTRWFRSALVMVSTNKCGGLPSVTRSFEKQSSHIVSLPLRGTSP
ncbi:hypothetical protein BDV24DRAFT_19662 [Aspergillus arachidicola]|uniref:Uncharacterized protein n=1 Tax=Aspergillus arachidicola TaxID=656916 RepID=A0A5N6YHS6_9EURO|nr:hypothetical protein BDV24DRAFT_19662 [Aspergillus arachidicola]